MSEIIDAFTAKGMSRKQAVTEYSMLEREYNEIVNEVADPYEAYNELVSLFRRFGLSADYIDDMAMM